MSRNICIYFSDTGGGHRSAADAIESAIAELLAGMPWFTDVQVLTEPLAEKSHPINRGFVDLYNYLLGYYPSLMKYYYRLLHVIRPESGFNYWLTQRVFCAVLEHDQPSVVVSVHPMLGHCLAFAMRRLGIQHQIPLIVVITDPNTELWRAWACPDADLIIAPNEAVKLRLQEWGIPEERINTLGMPIHPNFVKPPTVRREALLASLGLATDRNRLTLCLNSGWAGGGKMLDICRALSVVRRPIQVVLICGKNQVLYQRALELSTEIGIPMAVLPLHEGMSDLMSAVDLMVTKGGGLTTYEALARRLPIIFDLIEEPMPQEKGTVEMLLSAGVAWTIRSPAELVHLVEGFTPFQNRVGSILPAESEVNLTDRSIYSIASEILSHAIRRY